MGTLRWLIHAPFLHYVEGLPDCSIEVTDGARRADDGSFVFPLTAHSAASGRSTVLTSHGRVVISAYDGMLRVDLINPRLELDRDSGRLFTENPYRAADFVPIANVSSESSAGLAASEPGQSSSAAVHLTSQGVGWLSDGRYPAGQRAAPIRWSLPEQASISGGSGGTPGARTRIAGRTRD